MALFDVTLPIPLQRWATTMQMNQFNYNQLAGAQAPLNVGCAEVYVKPERDFIANALVQAGAYAADQLGYHVRPTYHRAVIPLSRGYPLELQTLKLPKGGYLQSIGQRATSVIQAGAAVVYSDSDGDGFNDLATITVATTVNVTQIQAFFTVASGAPSAANEQWQIEPLQVRMSGGNAIITGHMSLFALPSIWALPYLPPNYTVKNDKNSNDPASYVTTVDIYRVYPDSTNAVTLRGDDWLTSCNEGNCDTFTQSSCARIADAKLGSVQIRPSSCVCGLDYYAYSQVEIYYLAGYPLDVNMNVDRNLEQAIVWLANILMPQKPCDYCERVLNMWSFHQQEIPDSAVPPGMWSQPYGVNKRGAVQAYKVFERAGIGQGGKMTMGMRP